MESLAQEAQILPTLTQGFLGLSRELQEVRQNVAKSSSGALALTGVAVLLWAIMSAAGCWMWWSQRSQIQKLQGEFLRPRDQDIPLNPPPILASDLRLGHLIFETDAGEKFQIMDKPAITWDRAHTKPYVAVKLLEARP